MVGLVFEVSHTSAGAQVSARHKGTCATATTAAHAFSQMCAKLHPSTRRALGEQTAMVAAAQAEVDEREALLERLAPDWSIGKNSVSRSLAPGLWLRVRPSMFSPWRVSLETNLDTLDISTHGDFAAAVEAAETLLARLRGA